MTKLPLTVLTMLPFTWMVRNIHVYKSAPIRGQTLQEAQTSFEKGFWTHPPVSSNGVISGPIQMGKPPHEIFCMKATSAGRVMPVSTYCMLEQGEWDAIFTGEENDLETFFAVLRALR